MEIVRAYKIDFSSIDGEKKEKKTVYLNALYKWLNSIYDAIFKKYGKAYVSLYIDTFTAAENHPLKVCMKQYPHILTIVEIQTITPDTSSLLTTLDYTDILFPLPINQEGYKLFQQIFNRYIQNKTLSDDYMSWVTSVMTKIFGLPKTQLETIVDGLKLGNSLTKHYIQYSMNSMTDKNDQPSFSYLDTVLFTRKLCQRFIVEYMETYLKDKKCTISPPDECIMGYNVEKDDLVNKSSWYNSIKNAAFNRWPFYTTVNVDTLADKSKTDDDIFKCTRCPNINMENIVLSDMIFSAIGPSKIVAIIINLRKEFKFSNKYDTISEFYTIYLQQKFGDKSKNAKTIEPLTK